MQRINAAGARLAQARLLDQNASAFDAVGDKLAHAGALFQGFTLGMTAGLTDSLSGVLDQLQLD